MFSPTYGAQQRRHLDGDEQVERDDAPGHGARAPTSTPSGRAARRARSATVLSSTSPNMWMPTNTTLRPPRKRCRSSSLGNGHASAEHAARQHQAPHHRDGGQRPRHDAAGSGHVPPELRRHAAISSSCPTSTARTVLEHQHRGDTHAPRAAVGASSGPAMNATFVNISACAAHATDHRDRDQSVVHRSPVPGIDEVVAPPRSSATAAPAWSTCTPRPTPSETAERHGASAPGIAGR